MISSDIYAPLIATCMAEISTLPACTVKTRYQNTNSNSIINTFISIRKQSGIKGFYNASMPAITSQAFSTTSKYSLYKYFNNKFGSKSHLEKTRDSIFSGLLTSLMTHPIDTIKIHKQMHESIFAKKDIKLFYRGYSKSFSKNFVGAVTFYPLYDFFHSHFSNSHLASLTSGILSVFIIHPIDYLKTRHIYGLSLYQGINPLSYYKGISLNLLRTVPHFYITMVLIDFIKNY